MEQPLGTQGWVATHSCAHPESCGKGGSLGDGPIYTPLGAWAPWRLWCCCSTKPVYSPSLASPGQGACAFDPTEGRPQDPRVPGQVGVRLHSLLLDRAVPGTWRDTTHQ